MRSWAATVERHTVLSKVRGSIGSFAGYSSIHEFGETVYGKPWIYIPSDENRKPDGRALYTPSEVINKRGGRFTTVRTKSVIVDQDDTIMYFLVRWARYSPQLEFFKREQVYGSQLIEETVSRIVDFWKGSTLLS